MIGFADTDTSRRRRKRPLQVQRFSSYLSFGFLGTACLGIFLIVYLLVLLCASPLLNQAAPNDASHLTRGQVLKPVVTTLGERVKKLPHNVKELKEQFQNFRKSKGVTDTRLIDMAQAEVDRLRKDREESAAVVKRMQAGPAASGGKPNGSHTNRTGFMVMGMHRSGTSMLGGLLVNGLGYNPGGPLIGSKFDNEKGFFELVDAVLQNDEFMNLQHIWWSANVMHYDDEKALQDKQAGKAKFGYGKRALAFLNNPNNAPYMQKDPRMCITVKTWLKLMNNEPAILWTYRHPMEVANSLIRREQQFTLDHTLRLWIVYNMRGLQNTAGLCRVYSSNDKVIADPMNEVQRISDELTTKCGVPAPPNKLTKEEVGKIVDLGLQHNKKRVGDNMPVIAKHGACEVHELTTKERKGSDEYVLQNKLYLIAMKLYCDMESGEAYEDGYNDWPVLP
jgi:hypothetical protein